MYIVKLNNTPSIPKKPDVLDMIAVAKEWLIRGYFSLSAPIK
jgi:hypothetical protein